MSSSFICYSYVFFLETILQPHKSNTEYLLYSSVSRIYLLNYLRILAPAVFAAQAFKYESSGLNAQLLIF